jgi:hypothetical protein
MGVSARLEFAVGFMISPLEKTCYDLAEDGALLEIRELRRGWQVRNKIR